MGALTTCKETRVSALHSECEQKKKNEFGMFSSDTVCQLTGSGLSLDIVMHA